MRSAVFLLEAKRKRQGSSIFQVGESPQNAAQGGSQREPHKERERLRKDVWRNTCSLTHSPWLGIALC